MRRFVAAALATTLCSVLAGCGGGGGEPVASVAIRVPADTGTWTQTEAEVTLGGTVSGAGYVVVHVPDGRVVTGFVVYVDGQGSWRADVYGLAIGTNRLTVVADHDGTERWTKSDTIDVIRTPG